MKLKKYWISIIVLIIMAILIRIFSADPANVEFYYSNGIYTYISIFLRSLIGWLPISVGDILYGLTASWLIFKLVKGISAIFKKRFNSDFLLTGLRRLLIGLLIIYAAFNILWGINYNRRGISSQLGLSVGKYSVDELKTLNQVLLQKINSSKALLLQKSRMIINSREIFNGSQDAYRQLQNQYAFISYHPACIKTSMWGWLGNYIGFMGYYNPFTGEGQVNTTVPTFLQPYTTCHEIAHQLGYAKENEANFVGYLAAAASKDESFHYSVYLDLFLYANRNLSQTDSLAARAVAKQLLPAVKQDLVEWRKFNYRHKNPVEPVIRWVYGKYLQSNQQPSGVLSYDEVTGFMIAYYKKYGKL